LFGLARSRSLGTPLTLVVSGARVGMPPRPLFEKTLDDASPVSWRDYRRKPPSGLAGATVRLSFAVRSAAGPAGAQPPLAGALLCSNPAGVADTPAPAPRLAGALLSSTPVVLPDTPPPGRHPNVLLISLDTVGARHLGLGEDE